MRFAIQQLGHRFGNEWNEASTRGGGATVGRTTRRTPELADKPAIYSASIKASAAHCGNPDRGACAKAGGYPMRKSSCAGTA